MADQMPVKERPILFSAPMVRAILEGRKTVTRRVVKPQPDNALYLTHSDSGFSAWHNEKGRPLRNPYGQPGDRLWVRETWYPDPDADHDSWDDHTETYFSWSGCGARIDGVPPALQSPEHCIYRAEWDGSPLRWKSSIHMPRWASRITLEVTGVRVERLQEIRDESAVAEGCGVNNLAIGVPMTHPAGETVPRVAFRDLWESINGADSWDANPWVWVVEFKRVAP